MVERKLFIQIVSSALIALSGCRMSSPDWNGTWNVNPAESNFQGQVLTISVSGNSEYRFEEKSSHTIRCDGMDQSIGNNTLVCIKNGDTTLDITYKENGIKSRVTHDELSTDKKAFTATVTEFKSGAPVVTSQTVFSRLSGSNDFAGQWLDTIYLKQHANMILRLDNQGLHIDYPSAGQHIDAPLDGIDAEINGPNAPKGATIAIRRAGNREFLIVTKSHGNVLTQGSLKLSNDGRIITESWWNPNQPDEKGALVYSKS